MLGTQATCGPQSRDSWIKQSLLPQSGRPFGAPGFLGDDRAYVILAADLIHNNWPLEPIELVDEIPFVIVTGCTYQGLWDPTYTEAYVRYCITNCDWSNIRFTAKTAQQKEIALRKLISSPKWERPLKGWEQDFLRKQLE